MKKILAIFTTLLLLFTIVACGKVPEYFAEFKVDVDRETTLIAVEIELTDPDDEVKGDIFVTLKNLKTDKKDSKTTNKEKIKEDKEDNKRIEFNNLDSGTDYELEIKTTINEKSITVYKKTYKTRTSSKVSIRTTEDFLKIRDRRSATYILEEDLDFKDVDPSDINKGVITIFSGNFDGNNKTIKNFTLESSSINIGLFGQLSGSAEVKNLNLENITIKQKGEAKGSKRAGILFGQNTSRSTIVDNISIKNSKIELSLDSESKTQKVGYLGGAAVAKISNININNTNDIVINQERTGDVKIGSLIGKIDNTSSEDVLVENIITEGKINYTVTQRTVNEDDKETLNGLKISESSINIAGLVGQANNVKFKNVIVKTNIHFNESNFVLEKLEEKQRRNTKVFIDVSGLISRNANINLENIVYSGLIEIEKIEMFNKLDEDEKLGYELYINSSAFVSQSQIFNSKVKNVLRVDGTINVFESTDNNILVETGVLFTKSPNIVFNENNTFGVNNEALLDENSNIQVLNLNDLFDEDSFIINNFK